MNQIKKLLLSIIISALGLGVINLQAQVPEGTKLAKVQEIIKSNGTEPETLDPNLAESVSSHNILFDLFETLVTKDFNGKVVGGVASSWKRVSDTKWEFYLRKDAKFSDGSPVTASDFVYSAQRYLDPKTASPYAGTFGVFIKNGQEVIDGKIPASKLALTAKDNYTVLIETVVPTPYFAEILVNTQFAPIKKAVLDKHGKDWIKPGNMVSNGAYMLQDWVVNNKVVLVKNPHYWNAKNVTITKVTYLPLEDVKADLALYESGGTDYVYQLPVNNLDAIAKKYGSEYKTAPVLGIRYYGFNVRDPLLKDVRVRQALSMVVDRQLLADRVTADGEIPAYSMVIEGVNGGTPSTYEWQDWPMAKRIETAQKLISDAGIKKGTTLKVLYNTSELHKKITLFLASEWKSKLGLNATTEVVEFKVLLKRRHDLEYQISRNGWYADYNDVTSFLTLIKCQSPQNDTGYCDEEAEKLFDQAELQSDPDKRKALINQGVEKVMNGYPTIPILQYTVNRLVKSKVGGYNNNESLDKHLTKFMYIKAE